MAMAFSAFGDPIPWLIALAFFFARDFIKTGLGNRVAHQFMSPFGGSSLGLGYSLVFSEELLMPAIPPFLLGPISVITSSMFLTAMAAILEKINEGKAHFSNSHDSVSSLSRLAKS